MVYTHSHRHVFLIFVSNLVNSLISNQFIWNEREEKERCMSLSLHSIEEEGKKRSSGWEMLPPRNHPWSLCSQFALQNNPPSLLNSQNLPYQRTRKILRWTIFPHYLITFYHIYLLFVNVGRWGMPKLYTIFHVWKSLSERI